MLVLQTLSPPGKIFNINSIHIQLQNELILHTSHRPKVHCACYLSCNSMSQVLPCPCPKHREIHCSAKWCIKDYLE